eukprot:scaffold104252_cov61-Phaeocystis_antarctica.AAC.8
MTKSTAASRSYPGCEARWAHCSARHSPCRTASAQPVRRWRPTVGARAASAGAPCHSCRSLRAAAESGLSCVMACRVQAPGLGEGSRAVVKGDGWNRRRRVSTRAVPQPLSPSAYTRRGPSSLTQRIALSKRVGLWSSGWPQGAAASKGHFCHAARLQLLPCQTPRRHLWRRVDKMRIEREPRAATAATAATAASAAVAAAVAVADEAYGAALRERLGGGRSVTEQRAAKPAGGLCVVHQRDTGRQARLAQARVGGRGVTRRPERPRRTERGPVVLRAARRMLGVGHGERVAPVDAAHQVAWVILARVALLLQVVQQAFRVRQVAVAPPRRTGPDFEDGMLLLSALGLLEGKSTVLAHGLHSGLCAPCAPKRRACLRGND